MINILYITPNFTIGGTEGQIFSLATSLDRTRFTPCVISVGFDFGQRSEYAKHNIETRVFRISNLIKIILFIKRRKIDIMHSFYYGNFSGWELAVAKLAGVKTFITSRRNMGYWRRTRHLVFDLFRNYFTDIVVANSYAVREKSIVDEKLLPSRIIVIYNGINLHRYGDFISKEERDAFRAQFGLGKEDRVIGMISNIKSIKGYEYFLEAARIIKDSNYNVKFIVAGEGSDEDVFRKSVDKYDLKDSLISLGLCRDVVKVFSAIDIFMYSSLSEGFPNIILEAMASAKPIVSTDVGGTSEMLQGGYSGFLVPPRNASALADKAIMLLKDEDWAYKIGQTARDSVKQFFNMEECIRQYEFIYENLYQKKSFKR